MDRTQGPTITSTLQARTHRRPPTVFNVQDECSPSMLKKSPPCVRPLDDWMSGTSQHVDSTGFSSPVFHVPNSSFSLNFLQLTVDLSPHL